MTLVPVIETERLRLRGPARRDVAAYTAFYGSERSRFVGGPRTPGLAWRAFAALAGAWQLEGVGIWIVADRASDAALGHVGCWHPVDWPEPEIAWALYGGAEGRGIATEAARAARTCLFGAFGWTSAVSYIDPANTRSVRLAERLGCMPDVAAPKPDVIQHVVVYRHPAPEALQ